MTADVAPVDDLWSTALPSPTPRRRLIIGIAAFTMVVEAMGTLELVPGVEIGALELPLSVIPALALAVACGTRLIGRSAGRSLAIAYWLATAVALPALAVVYLRTGRISLWVSLVVAAFSEELIYRLAIPMVLAALLRLAGVRAAWSRPVAFAIAAGWFVALPGHREQVHQLGDLAPLLAFAALAALVVYRSGSVLPMAAAHAVSNLLTVLLFSDATSADQRGVSLGLLLGVLVVAYGKTRRITIGDEGELVDTQTGLEVVTVDLTDGTPTSATLADGTVIAVEGDLAGTDTADIEIVDLPGRPSVG